MSFSYKENKGFINYINEDGVFSNLTDEITSGNLLLKLNFEKIIWKCNIKA